jgi:hypothetical protein
MRAVPQLCWTTCSEVSLLRVDDGGKNVTTLRKALVLAPLFVHYEVLFMLGLLKQVKKDLHNDVGKLKTELRLKNKGAKKE